MTSVLFAVLGYLLGSIPFGLLFTRMAGLGDVRKIGSGNIGATNVLRTGNKKVAALTLLFDALKGFIPVVAAGWYGATEAPLFAAAGAIAGHLFPVWLGFKGGKGVATSIGVLFGLYWVLGLFYLVVWLTLAFVFKRSSLAALIASAASPLVAYFVGRTDLIVPLIVLAAVVWFMHRTNILRLIRREEPTINLGKK
jgi:acyl phosphate:glycerol-3-phosphate acyltransferase